MSSNENIFSSKSPSISFYMGRPGDSRKWIESVKHRARTLGTDILRPKSTKVVPIKSMKKNDIDFKTLKKWVKDCRKHENDSRSKQEKPWSKNQTPNIDYIEHVLEDVEEKDDNDQVFMSFFNDYYDKTAIFLKKIILPISNYSRDWYPESIEDNLNRNGLYNEIQKSIHKKQWKEFPKYVNGDVEYFFRRMLSMREEDEGKVSENVHKRFLDLKIQNTGNNRLDWSTFHAEASQLLEDFTEM